MRRYAGFSVDGDSEVCMSWEMIFFIWGMLCAYVVVRGLSG
ncbi:hypothetical protein [Inovirus D_HF2_82]|nr:hypothetical protein [Inovirus D_HF2_82]